MKRDKIKDILKNYIDPSELDILVDDIINLDLPKVGQVYYDADIKGEITVEKVDEQNDAIYFSGAGENTNMFLKEEDGTFVLSLALVKNDIENGTTKLIKDVD